VEARSFDAMRGAIEPTEGRSRSSSATPPWPCSASRRCRSLDPALVVLFGDVRWREPAFLDLIRHAADPSRGAPSLLLCIAGPELLERAPSWRGGMLDATTELLEPCPRPRPRS
jgi:hypothetical protein